ncbi:MAG: S1 RNA-binding domain-containing protein [Acholeplasmatales bacterium]|jgi:ribosomal protein S1|nr:S1 RNA-binding domain-containing protein [Acholeplasmatales bacterium]
MSKKRLKNGQGQDLRPGMSVTLTIFSVEKDLLIMTSNDEKLAAYNFEMHLDHYGDKTVKDFHDVYQSGDEITVTVEQVNAVVVYTSREKQKSEDSFLYLASLVGTTTLVSAKIVDQISTHGLNLDYNGISIFLPATHLEGFYKKDFPKYKGQNIEINIIKAEKKESNFRSDLAYDVVGSRKAIIEQKRIDYEKNKEQREVKLKEERKVLKKEEFASLKVGDIVSARVYKVEKGFALLYLKYGMAFLGGANYSHSKVEDLTEVLKPKDEVKAMVIEKDEDRDRVVLSVRALTKTPYQLFKEEHPIGSVIKGKITAVNEFGIVVDLGNDLTGFLHKYQVSYDPKKANLENYQKNQEVSPAIIAYEDDKNRISLSLKALESNAWDGVKVEVGSVIDAEVVDTSKRDVTVKVQGLDILIPNKEVYFDEDEPRVKTGDILKVKVLDFNKNNWVLRLSARILKAQKEFEAVREMEKQSPKVEITIGDIIDQHLLDELEASSAPKKKGKK